jgi:hypothetical protein
VSDKGLFVYRFIDNKKCVENKMESKILLLNKNYDYFTLAN